MRPGDRLQCSNNPSGAVTRLAVRPACDADALDWDELAVRAADSTFFHRFAWRRLMCEALGYRDRYLCAIDGERLVGVLPLVGVRSRLFGTSLTSLPFCSYGGPLAED